MSPMWVQNTKSLGNSLQLSQATIGELDAKWRSWDMNTQMDLGRYKVRTLTTSPMDWAQSNAFLNFLEVIWSYKYINNLSITLRTIHFSVIHLISSVASLTSSFQ